MDFLTDASWMSPLSIAALAVMTIGISEAIAWSARRRGQRFGVAHAGVALGLSTVSGTVLVLGFGGA
jgi:hypothetical protein